MENNLHPQTLAIAARLAETEPGPLGQISRALYLLPPDQVEAAVVEALRIESAGGLPTANGAGRHTLGGLFFFHLRKTVGKSEWQTIRYEAELGEPRPALAALAWEDRLEAVVAARESRGVVTDISLAVAGRPMAAKPQGDDYLVLALESNGTPPPLSDELPKPPSVATSFKVVVGLIQWQKLQGPIRNVESDLVAYGYPIPNLKQRSVVAFTLTAGVQARSDKEDALLPVSRAKLTLKPGRVVQRGSTLVMVADCSQPPKQVVAEYTNLPARVVSYVVYITQKQWRKVVGETDLTDRSLGLNGVCFYDPEVESLAVLVQNLHLI